MMFMDQTLEEFIKNVNSKELPGGGSISALTALLGVGIGNMSFYLTEDKKSFKALDEKTQQEIRSHVDRLTEIIEELKGKMVEDTKSFDSVLQAYKLPKETDEEKAYRKKMIADGYIIATESPMSSARIMMEAMELVKQIAKYIDKYAITDLLASAYLLHSSMKSVMLNAKINMKQLGDSKKVADEITALEYKSEVLLREIEEVSYKKIGEV
ncbi:MAG: cyclodeaminase/cyclohydrolase family protein [Finegoldia magna]|nr:cyclodeaminase/cyclohydrolase family protein [Finegoldia magna]